MPEPKRPGRPPLVPGDTPAKVQVYVPSREYDRAQRLAERTGTSVPEVLRRGLAKVLDESDDE